MTYVVWKIQVKENRIFTFYLLFLKMYLILVF